MTSLKQELANQTPLVGTFVKTPHFHVAEVLSKTSLDTLCLDAEHAPFARDALDACVLACRAESKPVLIRVPDDAPATILNALDIGATGIVIPHVKTAAQLENIVQVSFYGDKGRGYAGSTRAAGYTTQNITQNLALNQQTVVVAQIEDLEAIDNIEQIAQVDGVDCLFIGRMDLTVALGETNASAPSVMTALDTIIEAANRHGKTTGMFVGDLSELPHWIEKGVSLFLLASDHNFMLAGAASLKATFDKAAGN